MNTGDTTVLLRAVRGGSEAALSDLLERYGPRLLAVIRSRMGPVLRDRMESRDVLNAVLLKAFQHLDAFEGGDGRALTAWMSRIAENEIHDLVDRHRRARRDGRREEPLPDDLGRLAERCRSQTSRLVLREETERVLRAIARLEPDHREVILLRRQDERSWEEVSARMERSPDACRMLLARALAALTARIQETP